MNAEKTRMEKIGFFIAGSFATILIPPQSTLFSTDLFPTTNKSPSLSIKKWYLFRHRWEFKDKPLAPYQLQVESN